MIHKEASATVLYRIYTEDKQYTRTLESVRSYFEGFSIIREVAGNWKGNSEESIIIEIVSDEAHESLVLQCAEQVKNVNAQQEVLVTAQNVGRWFL